MPKNANKPQPSRAPLPKPQRPKARPRDSRTAPPATSVPRKHAPTGNVLGKIAGGLASSIPVVGGIAGPLIEAAVGGLTGGVTNSDWSGNGAVRIEQNSLINRATGKLEKVIDGQDGWTTFKYVEYIGNVLSASQAGGFTKQALRINPADPQTFPWLSKALEGYGQYKLKGMWAALRSNTSVVAPDGGSSLGRWGICGQYNPAIQEGYATLEQCLQADGGQNDKCCNDVEWAAECKPKDTVGASGYYTSAGAPPEGMNYAQTDPFVMVVWNEGVEQSDAVLGTLEIHYIYMACKKTLSPSTTSMIADIFVGVTDIQEEAPMGVELTGCASNTIGGTLTNGVINTTENGVIYKFPRTISTGRYLFNLYQTGMYSSGDFSSGTFLLYHTNCTINHTVLTPDPETDPFSTKVTSQPENVGAGPYGGIQTASIPNTVTTPTFFGFFVDVTSPGAEVGIVWNGVSATTMPALSQLSICSFPAAVTFAAPDMTTQMIFRNVATVNRLAHGLENAESRKDFFRIVTHMRQSLSSRGISPTDNNLLTNVHKKTHRDLLRARNFGRKDKDTKVKRLENQVEQLLSLLRPHRTDQVIADPWAAAPPKSHYVGTPTITHSDLLSDTDHSDSESELDLQDQVDLLEKKLKRMKKAAKASPEQPKAKVASSKSPMSYGITFRASEAPPADAGLTVLDLLPVGSDVEQTGAPKPASK